MVQLSQKDFDTCASCVSPFSAPAPLVSDKPCLRQADLSGRLYLLHGYFARFKRKRALKENPGHLFLASFGGQHLLDRLVQQFEI